MLHRLIISVCIIILSAIYYVNSNQEGFLDLNELEKPLKIQNECDWKQTDDCDIDIPLLSSSCNKVPNYPSGLEPEPSSLNNIEYPEVPFNRLAPKDGKYTFVIPELKYDGIYSIRLDNNNNCFWSMKPNKPETYGTDKYFHIPDESLYGKTIVSPPECSGYPTGFSPIIYLDDCKENVPCAASYTINA